MSGCPHCGTDRPAVEDPGYRYACPACGGPRLPPGATARDLATEQASRAALVRAKAKGDRGTLSSRLVAASAVLLTLSAMWSSMHGHTSLLGVLVMILMWTSFAFSYRRRHAIRAARVRFELDEAYALAGASTAAAAPGAHLRVMVPAQPDAKDAAHAQAEAEAQAAAEAEAEKEDAFADFDRRLAASQKKE